MFNQLTHTQPAKRHGRRRRLVAAAAVLAAIAVPATAAQADWFFTKSGAERAARHFVSHYYADTYASDLIARCRPQGRSYNPAYEYHRWVCKWADTRDGTRGEVLIVGSRAPGAYYGQVLHGAH